MKILASLAAGLLFGASLAVADSDDLNWNKSEHNVKIKSGDWGFEVRTYLDDDYDHMEVTKKLANGLTAALRYAEDGSTTEIRPKLTHKIWNNDTWSLGQRIEYRNFEGDSDDHWRYRAIIGLKQGDVWLKLQPRWTLGGDNVKDDGDIDNVKWQAGYNWTLSSSETSSVVLSPYVEYQTEGSDGDWKKKHMILGTSLSVKF